MSQLVGTVFALRLTLRRWFRPRYVLVPDVVFALCFVLAGVEIGTSATLSIYLLTHFP